MPDPDTCSRFLAALAATECARATCQAGLRHSGTSGVAPKGPSNLSRVSAGPLGRTGTVSAEADRPFWTLPEGKKRRGSTGGAADRPYRIRVRSGWWMGTNYETMITERRRGVGWFRSSESRVNGNSRGPNTYEAPSCQETHDPFERFFRFFPPVDAWRCQQTVSCPDLLAVFGCQPRGRHPTRMEVPSSRA